MARLELTVNGFSEEVSNMTINNKGVKVDSIVNGKRIYKIESDTDKAELIIYKTHYYNSKWWFLLSLFYYLISFFGLFDIKQDKKCKVVDCRYILSLTEDTKAEMTVYSFTDNAKVINLTSSNELQEISNIQYLDKVAQKRHKTMRIIKPIATFVIAITTILILVL